MAHISIQRVRQLHLTAPVAAISVIVIALIAVVQSEVAARVLSDALLSVQASTLPSAAGGLFVAMSAIVVAGVLLIVRRGERLRAQAETLGKQQAALERGRLAEALLPIGLAIGASLDLDRVLDVICQESLRLFDVDTSLLWFKEGDELVGRAAEGHNRAGFLGMRQPIMNNSLLGARVVRERRPILVNHAPESDGVHRSIVTAFHIESIMGVPLLSEDQAVGALVLIDTRNPERFGEVDLEVARIFGQQTTMAITHAQLYERIRQQANDLAKAFVELRGAYRTTLTALSAALDARDHETEGHSQRVTAYALTLVQTMGVQAEAVLDAVGSGALLHDVGKIGVSDSILHKPGALTETEWALMRQHPQIGDTILHDVAFLQSARTVVLYHHERWDGTGYPFRLSGEAIPLAARIFAVADTLDAITSPRPYRPARSFAEARAVILSQRGRQFDPAVVDAFAQVTDAVWQATAEQVRLQRDFSHEVPAALVPAERELCDPSPQPQLDLLISVPVK